MLKDRLLAAHAAHNTAELAELYKHAADQAGSLDAKCFYLTQAYIYALDAGAPLAKDLHKSLKDHGREA